MQLLFVGQQDVPLMSNPQLTYFKKVFKAHTPFAIEPIYVSFNRAECNVYEPTTLRAKIPRHADLLGSVYLTIETPDIFSDAVLNFRWAKYFGETLIRSCTLLIGGTVVDRVSGEFMRAWTSLTTSNERRRAYESMIGHTTSMYAPDEDTQTSNQLGRPPLRYRIGPSYPAGTKTESTIKNFKPSIAARHIMVPLPFWFCRDFANAIPLVALQYAEVEIVVELRPWSEMYRLYYNKDGVVGYHAPDTRLQAHLLENFVSNARSRYLQSPTVLDCQARLDCNYVYLDDPERAYFATKPLEYLIEQVVQLDRPSVGRSMLVDLQLHNPIKELVWVLKRSDQADQNDWWTFTDRGGASILETASILFNGVTRVDARPWTYFNYLQPYQHHSGNPDDGVYAYSFAIKPEQYQPSGSVNASRINSIQVHLTTKPPELATYDFDASFYAVTLNYLRIATGLAGVVYNT
jgi:hypothetical protein